MKKFAYLAAVCAVALALPAHAQSSTYSPRYDRDAGVQDIDRLIRDLDDRIDVADRQGRISPSQADAYIRELRDIETRLLDVRSRTFNQGDERSDDEPGRSQGYRDDDPYGAEDNRRDDRQPAPDARDNGDFSTEHS
jgi:hypothetical protein